VIVPGVFFLFLVATHLLLSCWCCFSFLFWQQKKKVEEGKPKDASG
jgi:hypothetical protein